MIEIADYDTTEQTRVSVWEARDVFPLKKRKPRILKKLMRHQLCDWRANSQYVKVHLNFWDDVVAHGDRMGNHLFIIVDGKVRSYNAVDYPSTTEKAREFNLLS